MNKRKKWTARIAEWFVARRWRWKINLKMVAYNWSFQIKWALEHTQKHNQLFYLFRIPLLAARFRVLFRLWHTLVRFFQILFCIRSLIFIHFGRCFCRRSFFIRFYSTTLSISAPGGSLLFDCRFFFRLASVELQCRRVMSRARNFYFDAACILESSACQREERLKLKKKINFVAVRHLNCIASKSERWQKKKNFISFIAMLSVHTFHHAKNLFRQNDHFVFDQSKQLQKCLVPLLLFMCSYWKCARVFTNKNAFKNFMQLKLNPDTNEWTIEQKHSI